MSSGKRAYDLLRGYVNREWDRIHGIDPFSAPPDRLSATSEIDDALKHPAPRPVGGSVPAPLLPGERAFDPRERASAVLGVTVDSEFLVIRRSFERLNKRADPLNFPDGSPEAHQAAQIQRRIQEAYRILTEGMDISEVRFRSLEIE